MLVKLERGGGCFPILVDVNNAFFVCKGLLPIFNFAS